MMSEPEPRAASTTTVPSASPETIRLRRGKSRPRGSHSIGISETTAPCSTIRSISGIGLVGVGAGVPAGEHADRAGLEARDMGALVDAAREARHHDVARLADAARQPFGEGQARRRGVARADDRHRRLLQRLLAAAKREDRRGGVDLAQDRGIVRLAQRDEAHPSLRASASSRSISSAVATRIGRARAAAAGEVRQRLERRARAAAGVDQGAEGARADVLRADQPQPVEQLLVGEARRGRLSSPWLTPARSSIPSRREGGGCWRCA